MLCGPASRPGCLFREGSTKFRLTYGRSGNAPATDVDVADSFKSLRGSGFGFSQSEATASCGARATDARRWDDTPPRDLHAAKWRRASGSNRSLGLATITRLQPPEPSVGRAVTHARRVASVSSIVKRFVAIFMLSSRSMYSSYSHGSPSANTIPRPTRASAITSVPSTFIIDCAGRASFSGATSTRYAFSPPSKIASAPSPRGSPCRSPSEKSPRGTGCRSATPAC